MEQLCECGCGDMAGFYATTAKGHRAGEPRRFINHHNKYNRRYEPIHTRYEVEDRGYESPCWVWRRSKNHKGYGVMLDQRAERVRPAHVWFYEQFIAAPFPKHLQADHLCRVRACVNPWHIEPVTQYVNQQRGANAKLTREQADEIRRRGREIPAGPRNQHSSGDSYSSLSREFGVSMPVVVGIVRGHLWP
jgi:hypothetical protein